MMPTLAPQYVDAIITYKERMDPFKKLATKWIFLRKKSRVSGLRFLSPRSRRHICSPISKDGVVVKTELHLAAVKRICIAKLFDGSRFVHFAYGFV